MFNIHSMETHPKANQENTAFKVGDWIIITAFNNKKLIVKYKSHILKENVLTINNNIYFPAGRGLRYVKPWQPKPI